MAKPQTEFTRPRGRDMTMIPLPSRFRRMFRVAGVDRAVGYTILSQVLSLVSRPLLLAVMIAALSPEEQGYQYTILGLLGLKALFELGAGVALVHVIGREGNRLTIRPGQTVSGEAAAFDRVASLVRKTVAGYAVIAAGFVAVMLPTGESILAGSSDSEVQWQAAWIVAVLATAAGFPIQGVSNILIGAGNMQVLLRLRLWVGVVQAGVYGGLLWAGAGLLAAPLGIAVGLALELVGLAVGFRVPLLALWRHPVGPHRVNWLREVFPLQWRVGLSWLSNYLLSQALIPIIFRHCGDVAAGRFGLTLAVVTILQGFAFSWVATKIPGYAASVGSGHAAGMRQAFARDLRLSLAVYTLGAITAVGGLFLITLVRPALAERLLPVGLLGACLVCGSCWLMVECLANVLYTFHKEPLMPVRVTTAAATLGGGWLCARYGGLAAIVGVMAGCSVVSASLVVVIYRRFMAAQFPDPAPTEGG